MDELCFRYSAPTVARGVVDEIRTMHPGRSAQIAVRGAGVVIELPVEVWSQPLVLELVLGLGGRLTPCDAAGPVEPEGRGARDG